MQRSTRRAAPADSDHYPPNYQISGVTEWAEEGIRHLELIGRGFRETGWDERSVQMFATRYSALQRTQLPRTSLINGIRELLRMRKRVTEETWIEVVDVPLYRFVSVWRPSASRCQG